jgi:hypothetical protein
MTKTKERVDIRAYQILKAAEGSGKLMVGKPVVKKKLGPTTAYEIVQRDSHFAYRIVEAVTKNGNIISAETLNAGDLLTFDQCVEFITNYQKFKNAAVRAVDEPVNSRTKKWHATVELHFEATGDLDGDELYDALWMAMQHIQERRGQDGEEVAMYVPEGVKFSGISKSPLAINVYEG